MTQEPWRGIKTNSKPRFEDKAITKLNRFKLKSMKLPRIDDEKRLAGFPGLTGICRPLSRIIPNIFDTYVEPFAGKVQVYQALKLRKDMKIRSHVLNDTSDFVVEWLRREFTEATITQEDFTTCINSWDSPDTLFLLDWPWFKTFYNQTFSSFNRDSVKRYDEEVLDICKNISGKFIITTRKENTRMLKSGFNNMLIESEYIISGNYPKTLITTNIDLDDLK